MNILKKFFLWWKSKFGLEPVKQLQAPNIQRPNLQTINSKTTDSQQLKLQELKLQHKFAINQTKKENFVQSLKINHIKKRKMETLICYGDGIGIKKKLSC